MNRVTIDCLFRQMTPAGLRWSPDGKWLVFSLGYSDSERNAAGSALRLMSRDGREEYPVTLGRKPDGSPASDTLPCWSPDGRRVAFCSNRSGEMQVWAIPAFGGEAAQVTAPDGGCGAVMADPFYAGLDWSPDGSRLVFAAPLRDPPEPEPAARMAGFDYGETYGYVRSRIHLWTVDAEGGAARRITDGEYDHGDPRWSPDGRRVLFVSNRSRDEGPVSSSINKRYDLWLVPAEGGPERRITENEGPDFSPRWSPDGSRIAYLAGDRCGPHRDQYRVHVLDVETGATRDLTGDWDGIPETLGAQCWSSDGRWLLFSAWTGAATHLFRVPAAGGAVEALTEGRQVFSFPALAPDDAAVACVSQDEIRLAEVEVRPLSGGPPALTRFNAWLEEYELSRHEAVSWVSDEWTIEGILVRPSSGQTGPHPALLFSHGGPHHRVTCALNLEWQALAAAGYLVLAPNFRGSAGYGRAFLDADRGDWGGGDFRDLMRGLDLLVSRGMADPGRLGMLGGSYGGYMTAWSVGNTDRFKAAVARAPITHLVSYFGTTDLKTLTGWDLGGPPWEKPDLYRERSPVTHAARIKTPVLLLHGEADRRVPVTQSEEFYTALKELGVDVSFARYPDEGHMIAQPRHVRDYWLRTLEWFGRYL
jgi:dipeptidyl aminopeptidase/acylaminoacyl peptidase